MNWNYKKIRKTAWDTVFRKGSKPLFLMGIVCFLFAFFGVTNASQTIFIDTLNKAAGASDIMMPGNAAFLVDYLETTSFLKIFPWFTNEFVLTIFDSWTRNATWLVRLIQMNPSYIERNPGEVVANLALAATVSILFRFLVQNVFRLGKHRYFMENRFQKEVTYRRTLVPFHRDHLCNVTITMVKYHVTLALWNLTIIGGIIKHFEYCMVPYLVAENPAISWKDAKKLSSQMTRGYKWKLFLTNLSYCYMWLLKLIPLLGLFTSAPLEAQLGAEEYFTLRAREDLDRSLFTETGFDRPAYVEQKTENAPAYVLRDIELETPHAVRDNFPPYTIMDLIAIFFAFSFVGWIWEEGLTLVNHHMLVNRGVMHGPWLPIYGIGGVGMIIFLYRFKDSPKKLFLTGVGLCAVLEYAASFLLDFLFNSSYWDYKQMLMNVNGRICLAGLLAFGIGGMFGVYIAGPFISRELNKLSRRKQIILCTVLCTLFVIDLVCVILFGPNSGANVGGNF